MVIPKKTRDKWKILKSSGDVKHLAAQIGVHRRTISRAINGSTTTIACFEYIKDYYDDVEQKLKSA